MSWRLRLRALLDAQFWVVAAALVVVLLLGAWGTYTAHVDPGMTSEERVDSTWSIEGTFDHRAVVTRSNPVYSTGATLENRSIYPARIAPEIEGAFEFGYTASDSGDLDVDVEIALHRRAVVDVNETTETVWEHREALGGSSWESLEPGERMAEAFEFDLTTTANETEQIEAEVGEVPGEIGTAIRADVHISGRVNGESVDENRTYALSMRPDGDAYRLSQSPTSSEAFESTVRVPVERTYSPLRTVGGPLSLAVALVLLGGLVAARRRGLALDEDERAYLTYRDDLEDLDEWIATMSFPGDADESERIEAASLADLVDFAIDTDSGVVYDPDRETYAVRHRGSTYVYYPPSDVSRDAASDVSRDAASEGADGDGDDDSGTA